MKFFKNFLLKSNKKLITHNGAFHADDIFACAALELFLEARGESFTVTRTRDEALIAAGDYVFDVGGIYDAEKNRFDHHQIGGAGKRNNGIEYAAFGLVWKKIGVALAGSQAVADTIDQRLVAPIDAHDNGFDLVQNKSDVSPYLIQNFFGSMRPTWREDSDNDEMFLRSVLIAREVLAREIIQSHDALAAKESVTALYTTAPDKRVIVLDKNYPFEYILKDFREPLFAIYPRKSDGYFGVKAIKEDPKSFKNRKDFPAAWP